MRTKLALILIVTAMFVTPVSSAVAGSSTNLQGILISTDPIPVDSGEDAEIRFKIRNTGSATADDVTVEILDSYPFNLKPDRKREYELGDIRQGEEYFITTEVIVSDDANDGMANFKARVRHGEFSFEEKIPVEVQDRDIELNLANLKTSPARVTPDMEDVKLSLETVNNGEKTAENVVVDIDLPESFEKTSSFSTRQSLGNILAGEIKQAEFIFDTGEDSEKGMVDVPVNLSYSADDSGRMITEERSFSFQLSGRPQFEVTGMETELKTGQRREIRLQVENTGSEKSESTRIRVLDSADMPFSYDSSSKYIGTLEPGQEGTAVFQVETESDASAKQYLMDFEARGVKDTEVYTEDKTVPVEVNNGGEESGPPIEIFLGIIALIAVAGYVFRDRLRQTITEYR